MGNENEAGDEGDFECDRPISFPLGRKAEGKENKPKNKSTRSYVDEKIDQMVAEDIQSTEIEVNGKSEIGKKADGLWETEG